MKISKEEVEHIAELAHIELNNEELQKYGSQLESILTYIDQLNEVNTDSVSGDLKVKDLSNVWREDNIVNWEKEEVNLALNQGDIEAGNIKVKKIL